MNNSRMDSMRKYVSTIYIFLFLSLFYCACTIEDEQIKKWEEEIISIEKQFESMVQEKGIAEGFIHFADENAVLNRNNKIIKGKAEIRKYFKEQNLNEIKLNWKPDFVDISKSGDLAYTYGHYLFSAISPKGDTIKSDGVFHTVWKRQSDGSWKYVWD
jgi:ketosteroid isomerase-like protein